MRGRVDAVETGVTVQMEKTMTMLEPHHGQFNYAAQATTLGEIKEAQEQFEKRL